MGKQRILIVQETAIQNQRCEGCGRGERRNPPMPCQTEIKLLDDFAESTTRYFSLVAELCDSTGVISRNRDLFLEYHGKAKQAQNDCIRALEALQRHRLEHGCQEQLAIEGPLASHLDSVASW
jgi:hypothetical protein